MGKRSEKSVCSTIGKEQSVSSALCRLTRAMRAWKRSGRALGVGKLSGFKRLRLIASLTHPHPIHNTYPDVCQGSYGHTMGLALSAFPLVISQCPSFFPG